MQGTALSAKEKEILQLLADGNRCDAASVKLVPPISERAYIIRVHRIRKKLGCETSTEAVAKCLRAGLLV
jgi:DNA-binding CsgD family transcriptional regulator